MKFYSNLEKRAIDILAGSSPDMMHVQSFGTLVKNLINDGDKIIHADLRTNTVSIRSTEGGIDSLLTSIDDVVAVACLVDYLESQHYIKLYDLVENAGCDPEPDKKYVLRSVLQNSDLSKWICKYWNQQIYVSSNLKVMKSSEYKSAEDLYMEEQAKISRKQLFWVRLSLIATVIVQIVFL
ncbi:MAG: hypothetical protein LLF93_03165 [Bacteroidales bacterium]|nr:hypothetical protein [Bacteroidales bacterium]